MLVKPLVRPIVRAIAGRPTASLGGGFAPTSLFAANEPGYLYDLDDLSTVFLDSAGTTPATVNGLVGLVLDKSKGLALGAELTTNGTFDTDASWTKGVAWSISGGKAVRASGVAPGGSNLDQSFSDSSGLAYKVIIKIDSLTAGDGSISVRLAGGTQVISPLITAAGTYEFILYGNGTNTVLRISASTTNVAAEIDYISVKELPGNHAYQAATGSKPILRGTPTGANLASGASWTAGTGWSIAGDTATATTSSGTLSAASIAAVVGKFYRVTYTITRTAGSIQPTLGGRTGTARSASGTYVQYFDNATSTAALVFTGTGFSGTVTLNTIEAVDISAGSVSAPYALQYDGVDDFLQTAAVNFTATDKLTVCHGVRKIGTSAGTIVELATTDDATNGMFSMFAELLANTYTWRSKGTLRADTEPSGYTPPITNVVCGLGDISGDRATIRINGVQAAQSVQDQGTGNYGNYAIYFGRRGGTSIPFNGLMYSSVCIGRLLTAAELANVERWVGRKTGISL